MSFIAATMASVEMPANRPASTGDSPSNRPKTTPNKMPMPTLTANSVPPFFRRYGVDLKSMLAPVQTKNTARIGSAPVNSAPVNEPKNPAVPGAKVVISAPHNSGTTMSPPGTRSMARLIGTCFILAFACRRG